MPNAIGYARAALIPAILIFAYASNNGTTAGTGICFFFAGAGDYADGITARITGQYSRMGAILDPVLDRLLALSGLAICWSFELLPRWLIAVVIAREALMLVLGQAWLRRGLALAINWPGRVAVGPTLFGIWLALLGVRSVAESFLYVGITLALIATGYYLRDGMRQLGGSGRK